ncbi:MAG: SPFH/Band 7/PHB domain protein [Betaproteobacteria bacterium]|nr:SPFH/Band 7/PHB domain protein [Betaproteobacteria bacterium]
MAASIGLFAFFAVTVAKGVRTVPQGEEWVVERFGRYLRTLAPGLSVIIPFFDRVAYRVVTKDIVLDVERQDVITSDNAVIATNAVAFIKISDPLSCVYGVVDFRIAVRNLVQTALRSIIGEMTLDDALSSREKIKARLRGMVAEDMESWGVTLKTVEIQDIQPSPSMQASMEQQAAAERDRKAMITRSEGAKQSAILEAEGRLESAKRDAEAEVALAEASKKAIMLVRETTKDDILPLTYLLGQRYVDALKAVAHSESGKFVILPADLQQAVRGILAPKQ